MPYRTVPNDASSDRAVSPVSPVSPISLRADDDGEVETSPLQLEEDKEETHSYAPKVFTPAALGPVEDKTDDGGATSRVQKADGRFCGRLSRRSFVVLAVLLAAIVLAVVLGPVLSIELKHDHSKSSSSSGNGTVSNGTVGNGIAILIISEGSTDLATVLANIALGSSSMASTAIADGSGILLYYVNNDSVVTEVRLEYTSVAELPTSSNISGSTETLSDLNSSTIYPYALAAVSYMYDGLVTKSLFFVEYGTLRVMTINATGVDGEWSSPSPISDGVVLEQVFPALGACASGNTSSLQRIEVFYGDAATQNIREVAVSYNSTAWEDVTTIDDSNSQAGVGCGFTYDASSMVTYLDLYYLMNSTEGNWPVSHSTQWWPENLTASGWIPVSNELPSDVPSKTDLDAFFASDLSVTTVGEAVNYVFWQDPLNVTYAASANPGSAFSSAWNLSSYPFAASIGFTSAEIGAEGPLFFMPSPDGGSVDAIITVVPGDPIHNCTVLVEVAE